MMVCLLANLALYILYYVLQVPGINNSCCRRVGLVFDGCCSFFKHVFTRWASLGLLGNLCTRSHCCWMRVPVCWSNLLLNSLTQFESFVYRLFDC